MAGLASLPLRFSSDAVSELEPILAIEEIIMFFAVSAFGTANLPSRLLDGFPFPPPRSEKVVAAGYDIIMPGVEPVLPISRTRWLMEPQIGKSDDLCIALLPNDFNLCLRTDSLPVDGVAKYDQL